MMDDDLNYSLPIKEEYTEEFEYTFENSNDSADNVLKNEPDDPNEEEEECIYPTETDYIGSTGFNVIEPNDESGYMDENRRVQIKEECVEALWLGGKMGTNCPRSLLLAMWFIFSRKFHIGSRSDHVALVMGNIKVITDSITKKRCLTFIQLETRVRPRIPPESLPELGSDNPRCPVTIFESFCQHRPPATNFDDAPIYLQPVKGYGHCYRDIWYTCYALGKNKIGALLNEGLRGVGLPPLKNVYATVTPNKLSNSYFLPKSKLAIKSKLPKMAKFSSSKSDRKSNAQIISKFRVGKSRYISNTLQPKPEPVTDELEIETMPSTDQLTPIFPTLVSPIISAAPQWNASQFQIMNITPTSLVSPGQNTVVVSSPSIDQNSLPFRKIAPRPDGMKTACQFFPVVQPMPKPIPGDTNRINKIVIPRASNEVHYQRSITKNLKLNEKSETKMNNARPIAPPVHAYNTRRSSRFKSKRSWLEDFDQSQLKRKRSVAKAKEVIKRRKREVSPVSMSDMSDLSESKQDPPQLEPEAPELDVESQSVTSSATSLAHQQQTSETISIGQEHLTTESVSKMVQLLTNISQTPTSPANQSSGATKNNHKILSSLLQDQDDQTRRTATALALALKYAENTGQPTLIRLVHSGTSSTSAASTITISSSAASTNAVTSTTQSICSTPTVLQPSLTHNSPILQQLQQQLAAASAPKTPRVVDEIDLTADDDEDSPATSNTASSQPAIFPLMAMNNGGPITINNLADLQKVIMAAVNNKPVTTSVPVSCSPQASLLPRLAAATLSTTAASIPSSTTVTPQDQNVGNSPESAIAVEDDEAEDQESDWESPMSDEEEERSDLKIDLRNESPLRSVKIELRSILDLVLKGTGSWCDSKTDVSSPIVTQMLTDILYQTGALCDKGPWLVVFSMWWMIQRYIGITSRVNHVKLRWSHFGLTNARDSTGEIRECIQYRGPRSYLNASRAHLNNKHIFSNTGIGFLTEGPDFVHLYKFYANRRTDSNSGDDSPFYVHTIPMPPSLMTKSATWFGEYPLGKNRIGALMRNIIQKVVRPNLQKLDTKTAETLITKFKSVTELASKFKAPSNSPAPSMESSSSILASGSNTSNPASTSSTFMVNGQSLQVIAKINSNNNPSGSFTLGTNNTQAGVINNQVSTSNSNSIVLNLNNSQTLQQQLQNQLILKAIQQQQQQQVQRNISSSVSQSGSLTVQSQAQIQQPLLIQQAQSGTQGQQILSSQNAGQMFQLVQVRPGTMALAPVNMSMSQNAVVSTQQQPAIFTQPAVSTTSQYLQVNSNDSIMKNSALLQLRPLLSAPNSQIMFQKEKQPISNVQQLLPAPIKVEDVPTIKCVKSLQHDLAEVFHPPLAIEEKPMKKYSRPRMPRGSPLASNARRKLYTCQITPPEPKPEQIKTLNEVMMESMSYQSPDFIESVDTLWRVGVMGTHTPWSVNFTLWFINTLVFIIESRNEHLKLTWGDFRLAATKDGRKYVYFVNQQTKEEHYLSENNANEDPERCPYRLFQDLIHMRPESTCTPAGRFYLQPKGVTHGKGKIVWFTEQGWGKNKLGGLMSDASAMGHLPLAWMKKRRARNYFPIPRSHQVPPPLIAAPRNNSNGTFVLPVSESDRFMVIDDSSAESEAEGGDCISEGGRVNEDGDEEAKGTATITLEDMERDEVPVHFDLNFFDDQGTSSAVLEDDIEDKDADPTSVTDKSRRTSMDADEDNGQRVFEESVNNGHTALITDGENDLMVGDSDMMDSDDLVEPVLAAIGKEISEGRRESGVAIVMDENIEEGDVCETGDSQEAGADEIDAWLGGDDESEDRNQMDLDEDGDKSRKRKNYKPKKFS